MEVRGVGVQTPRRKALVRAKELLTMKAPTLETTQRMSGAATLISGLGSSQLCPFTSTQ